MALLLTGVLAIATSTYLLTLLDHLVHGELYQNGLQFDLIWAQPYWQYAQSLFVLFGLAIAAIVISIILLSISKPLQKSQPILGTLPQPSSSGINSAKLISPILFSIGIITFVASVVIPSSILAFIGLGLAFWGAILFYVRPQGYVKEAIMEKTTLPLLRSMDQIMTELGYNDRGVYLPPKYFTNFESVKVYMRSSKISEMPSPEEIQEQENKLFLKDSFGRSIGMLLAPSGWELMKLFERALKTNFTQIDLQYLKQNLPKVLVEMEIAQNVKMELIGDVVHVRIVSSAYVNLGVETQSFSKAYSSLGCPLGSAIACALVIASGRPLIIEKTAVDKNTKEIKTYYRLLEV